MKEEKQIARDSTDVRFYYRAMSLWEFELWRSEKEVYYGTEWISEDEERDFTLGYTLRFLKEEWVDQKIERRFGDLYAIIVGVRTDISDEFLETPGIIPMRYTNSRSIPFDRIKVVYDPEGIISLFSIYIDLNDPAKLLRE